jgi:carbamate kinase
MGRRIVVALGGNAILQPGERGTIEEQRARVAAAAANLARLVEEGHELILVHGNGPQVGILAIQNEEASALVPAMPLDVLGAESQGMIGYIIQQGLANELRRRGIDRPVLSVVTQVEVDPADPAFGDPTKPIGPFYTPERARQMMEKQGWVMKEDARRGWRRVVASPKPRRIVERPGIEQLVRQGYIVIACGGGGVPVLRQPDGSYAGVEAVIDKDLAACMLALSVEADVFMILTDVAEVKLHYKTPQEKSLGAVPLAEMERYIEEGHFAAGSMGPKVEAAVTFARERGRTAIITALECPLEAIAGKAGTRILGAASR